MEGHFAGENEEEINEYINTYLNMCNDLIIKNDQWLTFMLNTLD